MDPEIHDNPAHHRYELAVDGLTAYVLYRREPGVITFIHTEVPKALGGKGIGSRLARHVLDVARAEGLHVVPVCPFIAAWMKKHPDYDDLRLAHERLGSPVRDMRHELG
jgi:predicted GNAT family acetyltransferase